MLCRFPCSCPATSYYPSFTFVQHFAACLFLLLMQRDFEDVVVEKKGFKWVNERPDAKSENDEKWGWIGGKPGDFVVLGLDSRSSGDGAGEGASIGALA